MEIKASIDATEVCIWSLQEGDLFYTGGDMLYVADYVNSHNGFTHVIYHVLGDDYQMTLAKPEVHLIYTVPLALKPQS